METKTDNFIYSIEGIESGTIGTPLKLSTTLVIILWPKTTFPPSSNSATVFFSSVDARDRSFQQAERWSDENVFGNRAYFHSSVRPALLTIENVVQEDQGVYRCRVDFRVAQTRNSKVNLTIIGK